MRNKRTVAMPLMLMIALGMTGIAYATWTDKVTIVGTAEMGSLTIAFDPDELLTWVDDEHLLPVPKDVGWAETYYDEDSYVTDVHTAKSGYKTMIVNIHNAYPCYRVHFPSVHILNIGSIPATFVDIVVTGYNKTDGRDLVFEWIIRHKLGVFKDDVDDDGVLEEIINVKIVNFVGTQLEPCDPIGTKGEVDFHFKEDAEECHTYTFEIGIVAVNWNEA